MTKRATRVRTDQLVHDGKPSLHMRPVRHVLETNRGSGIGVTTAT